MCVYVCVLVTAGWCMIIRNIATMTHCAVMHLLVIFVTDNVSCHFPTSVLTLSSAYLFCPAFTQTSNFSVSCHLSPQFMQNVSQNFMWSVSQNRFLQLQLLQVDPVSDYVHIDFQLISHLHLPINSTKLQSVELISEPAKQASCQKSQTAISAGCLQLNSTYLYNTFTQKNGKRRK